MGEALARIAGYTYIINAGVTVTCTALGRGEKPSVPSAILKYHCTELARKIANDAMDVHGGKGIMLGPKNYLARSYQVLPVAITVEGANILTRSLIIFGQGAVRCHPFVLKEMEAAQDTDFERALRELRPAPLRPHRLRHQQRRPLVLAGAHPCALQQRAGERPDGALLPAHQPLQRRLRPVGGRRDAHARRQTEAARAAVGASRGRLQRHVPREHGAQALREPGPATPPTCRWSSGPAARCSTTPRSSCTASCATCRIAGWRCACAR